MKLWIQISATVVGLVLVSALVSAWRAQLLDRSRLQAELSATQKALADLDAKQKERDLQLTQTLKQLAEQKSRVRTPSQVLTELPGVLPLPTPLREAILTTPATEGPASSEPATPQPKSVPLPKEDLKPLFDFAVDCQACQARLASAQAALTDEKAKTQALSRERDDALRMAHGGSIWKRIASAAKWFAIGAAAGAIAAKAAH
jgi:hypothetical protein